MKTQMGVIQAEIISGGLDDIDTPLSRRLNEFGDTLAKIIGIACILVWLLNYKKFSDPALGGWVHGAIYYFKIAVSLAVAAIPEGLPAVITTCLALGTRRMAQEHAIIRKLPSVETLGCTTVICTDKTGTLTTNEMVVRNLITFGNTAVDLKIWGVSGHSYAPEGEIMGIRPEDVKNSKNIKLLCDSMSVNNESKLYKEGNRVLCSGLSTEGALRTLVEKFGKLDPENPAQEYQIMGYGKHLAQGYENLAVLEFDSVRKCMSVLCRDVNKKKNVLFTKGAPEYLLKNAKKTVLRSGEVVPLNENMKDELEQKIKEFALNGLRTLAICYKDDLGELDSYDGADHPAHKKLQHTESYAKFEENPVLIGIIGMHDPPRPEVKNAIKRCNRAGISVIMITGDIKETAQAIGKELGIISPEQYNTRSFTSAEWNNLTVQKRNEILEECLKENGGLIIARSEPKDKSSLVQELRGMNQIVAMTGDGVNDAPALKRADIGIAMGITGTSVAKEASTMILSDDNFATIVTAVEEGRAIYSNMKGFIRYMISSNIGEVLSIFLTSLMGIPDGFNSIQLLWVNLVTDGLPATALSFNPPSPDIMKKEPRKHDEPIVTRWVFTRYMAIGTYVGLATVGIFIYWYVFYDWASDKHTLVNFGQLASWSSCPNWSGFQVANFSNYDFSKNPCSYFTIGKVKASTLSLSVLVVIEMFNALNALSEETSLIKTGFWINPYLLMAIALSIFLHCLILYVPFLQNVFSVVPLTAQDWFLVIVFSFPVFLIDEVLKWITRRRSQISRLSTQMQKSMKNV